MMIKELKRNEVIFIGWSGDAEIADLLTGITYTIRGSVSAGYDHSDFQTKTPADTEKLRMAAGGNWNWIPRSVELRLKGHRIAAAIHSYPHSIPTASPADNIVNPALTRANERDANGRWRIGSHFCLHYEDTLDIRRRTRNDNSSWTRQMNAAIHEAVRLGQGFTPGTEITPAPDHQQPQNNHRPVTRRGSVGDHVRLLQETLNNAIGAGLDVDGIFGPLTEAAVRSFQGVHARPVDGIVGPITWAALEGWMF
jgi:hypothetical protein